MFLICDEVGFLLTAAADDLSAADDVSVDVEEVRVDDMESDVVMVPPEMPPSTATAGATSAGVRVSVRSVDVSGSPMPLTDDSSSVTDGLLPLSRSSKALLPSGWNTVPRGVAGDSWALEAQLRPSGYRLRSSVLDEQADLMSGG